MIDALYDKASELLELSRKQGIQIATAESCTGGLIAGTLTQVPGSSDVFERGFVTYTNLAKQEMLGVPANMLNEYGAVSEPVAIAMAEGAQKRSAAKITASVTGIAGPSGGSDTKPVGLVYIATATHNKETLCQAYQFHGDRGEIRHMCIDAALDALLCRIVG